VCLFFSASLVQWSLGAAAALQTYVGQVGQEMVTSRMVLGLGLVDVRVGDVGVACLFAVIVEDGVLSVEVVALLVEVLGWRRSGP